MTSSLDRDSVRSAANHTKKTVAREAAHVGADLAAVGNELTENLSGLIEGGFEVAAERLAGLKDRAEGTIKSTRASVRKQPLLAVACAAGLGMMLAGLAGVAAAKLRHVGA